MPSRWTRFLATIDPLVRVFGGYTAYSLTSEEYIGTVNDTAAFVREWLYQEGYEQSWLSAAKRHPETGDLHELSMRRVPEIHHFAAVDTALDDYDPSSVHYHVHAFDVNDGVALYSHYELRPLSSPLGHYRPVYDSARHERGEWTYLRGVTDLQL